MPRNGGMTEEAIDKALQDPRPGRPAKLCKKTALNIYFLEKKGCTNAEIAEVLNISAVTLWKWKESKTFVNTLKNGGKDYIDDKVENSLFSRAVGYEYEEEFPSKDGPIVCKKRLHPDPVSCFFWLKNRRPEEWREKTEQNLNVNIKIIEQVPSPPGEEPYLNSRNRIKELLPDPATN